LEPTASRNRGLHGRNETSRQLLTALDKLGDELDPALRPIKDIRLGCAPPSSREVLDDADEEAEEKGMTVPSEDTKRQR